ncbi:hypothetical protein AJ80_01821 [Polytolypa hystricis UAMH7299]|uniref:Uncharacterized protein n=1 Tax=Polytolypa hystricis (strain UAMH7299) TaxID=1447883 RepID=A0A2B7Z0Z9_POLH7|nr:hypothetical protein AJ80_01821 [Polytolypa hystricis UAMH7299]
MFLAAHQPSLIEFDGPKLEGFTQPILPANFEEMSPKAQQAAKELFLSQSLWLLYELEAQKQAPDLVHAFRYRDTHPRELLGAIGTIFNDGEPYMQSLSTDMVQEDVWGKVVGTAVNGKPLIPCPVRYSEEQLQTQAEQYALWQRDVDRKKQVLEELGAYSGWNVAVLPSEFDEMTTRVKAAKGRFLDREAKTAEEVVAWEQVWPFRGHT